MPKDNQWGNDASDIKNLKELFGNDLSKEQQREQEVSRTTISKLYPIQHTMRIELLSVNEITAKEPLPASLVTYGESTEYIEYGARYGSKESFMTYTIFLIGLLIQFIATLKSGIYNEHTLIIAAGVSMIISAVYGITYSSHIAKFSTGPLTTKLITSLLVGRLMIVLVFLSMVGFGLHMLTDYISKDPNVLLQMADAIVPDHKNMFYIPIAKFANMIMTPFGGGFEVTKLSVAYTLVATLPNIFKVWTYLAIVEIFFAFIPLIMTRVNGKRNYMTNNVAKEELENY
jgi:hypothetical protein